MVASSFYTTEPNAPMNTDATSVADSPMIVGNPALSGRMQRRSNKTALMIGIPVAALMMLGLGAAVVLGDKGSDLQTTTTQTSQTTTAQTVPDAPPMNPVAAALPTPVHAAANTMDATPPVTQSAAPTPVRHLATNTTRHTVVSHRARATATDASQSGADVSAQVPAVPTTPTRIPPPTTTVPATPQVVTAPPTAAPTPQPVNPAPDTTTTQP